MLGNNKQLPAPVDERVGSRVKLFWPGDERWYHGKIDGVRRVYTGGLELHVTYDDGDDHWEKLDAAPFAGGRQCPKKTGNFGEPLAWMPLEAESASE